MRDVCQIQLMQVGIETAVSNGESGDTLIMDAEKLIVIA